MYSIEKEQFERFPVQMTELAMMAEEMGYVVEWVDKWSGGLLNINDQYFGYGLMPKFPLNDAMSKQLVRDKVYAYMLLEKNGIKVPVGDYFFRYDEKYKKQIDGKGWEEAKEYAETIGWPVFVKPNRGALGRDCRRVDNLDELKESVNKIWREDYIAIVQKCLEGREYRVMFLDGEIILAYEKSKLWVEGDGVKKLSELLESTNFKFQISNKSQNDYNHDLDVVLEKGEKFYLTDVANLSGGGVVVGVVDDYSDELRCLVKNISEIFGLRYGGIDLMGDIGNIDEINVLEVNADPGLEGFLEYDRLKGVAVMRKLLQGSLKR